MNPKQFTVSECCGAFVKSIGALQLSFVCESCGKPCNCVDESEYFNVKEPSK